MKVLKGVWSRIPLVLVSSVSFPALLSSFLWIFDARCREWSHSYSLLVLVIVL